MTQEIGGGKVVYKMPDADADADAEKKSAKQIRHERKQKKKKNSSIQASQCFRAFSYARRLGDMRGWSPPTPTLFVLLLPMRETNVRMPNAECRK